MTARSAAILPAFLVAVSLSAAQPDGFNDGIDGTDPNFVTASLLVMSLCTEDQTQSSFRFRGGARCLSRDGQ